jgi:hypothetical protein
MPGGAARHAASWPRSTQARPVRTPEQDDFARPAIDIGMVAPSLARWAGRQRIGRIMTSQFLRTLEGSGVRVSAISVAVLAGMLGIWLVVALSVGLDATLLQLAPIPGLAR